MQTAQPKLLRECSSQIKTCGFKTARFDLFSYSETLPERLTEQTL